MGGGVTRAVAREFHHGVPDPEHLATKDHAEGQRQDHAHVQQREFERGLAATRRVALRASIGHLHLGFSGIGVRVRNGIIGVTVYPFGIDTTM